MLLVCTILFGFVQANHRPLLCLAILKMDQGAGFVFGQILNAGFHDRPAFTDWRPGRALTLGVDRAFDLERRVGCRVLERPGDDAFLADR